MKDQFVDYETAVILKGLGFDEECLGKYFENGGQHGKIIFALCRPEKCTGRHSWSAPLWQQVEQWLWEEHNISIEREERNHPKKNRLFRSYVSTEDDVVHTSSWNDSPITVKNEGIKAAVKHLHQQIKK